MKKKIEFQKNEEKRKLRNKTYGRHEIKKFMDIFSIENEMIVNTKSYIIIFFGWKRKKYNKKCS